MLKEHIDNEIRMTSLKHFTLLHFYILNWKNKTNRKLLGFSYTLSRLKQKKPLISFALLKNNKKRANVFDFKKIKYFISFMENSEQDSYLLNFHFINYNLTYANVNIFKTLRYINFFNFFFFLHKQRFNFFFFLFLSLANRLPFSHWWVHGKNLKLFINDPNSISLRSNCKARLFNFNLELI